MLHLAIYQVDAFTDRVFFGNPAAICPLDDWLPDPIMQHIALENNLPETAFLVARGDDFLIRWFTPAAEVDLCGHATLASAYVVFSYLRPELQRVTFQSASGPLGVTRDADGMMLMDFPALPCHQVSPPPALLSALHVAPSEVYAATDYLAVYPSEADILALRPDLGRLAQLDRRGVIASAPGSSVDFVSRFFAPKLSIPEDSITGSAHCMLVPYWSARLKRTELSASQHSTRLGAPLRIDLRAIAAGDRVLYGGRAVLYLRGHIQVPAHLTESGT